MPIDAIIMAFPSKLRCFPAALLLVTACLATPDTPADNVPIPEPDSHAFFIVGCGKPVLVERADPILYEGRPSQHLHSIMGGNAFEWSMGDLNERTKNSTCTTCDVTNDLSNYWVPTLFFRADNGSFISVPQVGGIQVYYQERIDWTEYQAGHKVEPFPPGFRMVAGDHARRHFDPNNLEHQAIEFVCLQGRDVQGIPAFHGFPNTTCDGGLNLRVRFPSCWDGQNVDSPDHQSHMAYPARIDSGPCPATHPRHLPSLLYENTWSITEFNSLRKPGDQPFVLSQGDPTGYGYHGDFLNGWDFEVLGAALADRSCGSESHGVIQNCKTLQPFLQSADVQNQCPDLPTRLPDKISGVIDKLPGCNPIQSGPAPAEVVADCPDNQPPPDQTGRPSLADQPNQADQADQADEGRKPSPVDSSDQVTVTVTVTAAMVTETVVIIHDEKEIEEQIVEEKKDEDKKDEKPKVEEQKPVTGSAASFRSTWVGTIIWVMRLRW